MCDRHGSQDFRSDQERAEPSNVFKDERPWNDRDGGAGRHDGLPGSAHAASTVKGTHGNGFCNVAFFITHARQLAKEDGLTLEFVNTPSFADQVTFLGTGQVDVSVMPYTNFMALYDAGAPVKIVAGGGVPGRLHRRPAGPRHAREAQGQDARDVPERYAGSASLRLAEEERRLLQGRHRSLHGFHGRHGRCVQGRLDRHRFHHRALWFVASQRRQRLRPACPTASTSMARTIPIASSPRARSSCRRIRKASRR